MKMKLGTKLVVAFLSISLIAAAVGLVGLVNLNRISAADVTLYRNVTAPMSNLLAITAAFQRIRSAYRDALLRPEADKIQAQMAAISGWIAEIEKALPVYESTLATDDGRRTYAAFVAAWKDFVPLIERIVAPARAGDVEAAKAVLYSSGHVTAALQKALDDLVRSKVDRAGAVSSATRPWPAPRSSS